MHLLSKFGLPLLHTKLKKQYDRELDFVKTLFTEEARHDLEDGGKSSRVINMHLHNNEEMSELCSDVLSYADQFWLNYGLDSYYEPSFNTVWANEHKRGHKTQVHNHSGSPIVGVYYFKVPENSGRLFFENPLEYHMCHEPRTGPWVEYVDVQGGDLVMFPGYLKHGTEVSMSDDSRIVVAFNFGYCNRKPVRIAL